MALEMDTLPWFDLLELLRSKDPYAELDALREQAPMWRSDFGAHVMTYQGCLEMFRDPRFHQDVVRMLDAAAITDQVVRDQWLTSLLGAPAEDHDRMRRLVSPSFTPRAIADLRSVVGDVVRDAAEAATTAGALEVMNDLATRLPPAVFCEMIGASADDAEFIGRVSAQILTIFARRPELGPSIQSGTHELMAYVDEFIDRRRSDPTGTDLISSLLKAEEAGERLTTEEMRALVIDVLEASTDNTSSQLALVLWAAAQSPDRWASLREDPSLISGFVEEASRLWPRIISVAKVSDHDADVAGIGIPAGTPVFSMVPSAHRDPDQFDRPLDFDPKRDSKALNLNFGSGAHYCIGANLARLEICGALEVLTKTWTSIALAGEPDLDFNPGVVTVDKLHLTVKT